MDEENQAKVINPDDDVPKPVDKQEKMSMMEEI